MKDTCFHTTVLRLPQTQTAGAVGVHLCLEPLDLHLIPSDPRSQSCGISHRVLRACCHSQSLKTKPAQISHLTSCDGM